MSDEAPPPTEPPPDWEPWMRKEWRVKFVDVLKKSANKSLACREAGISRGQLYRDLSEDQGFAQAVDDALDEGMDLLEQVAWQRATVGATITSTKTVTDSQGQTVSVETAETQRMSDTLLIFLLKGGRPHKYRDNITITAPPPGGRPVEVEPERVRSPERLGELLAIAQELKMLPSSTDDAPHTNGNAP